MFIPIIIDNDVYFGIGGLIGLAVLGYVLHLSSNFEDFRNDIRKKQKGE